MKTENEEVIKDEELESLAGGVSALIEQAAAGIQGVNRCCNTGLQENEKVNPN